MPAACIHVREEADNKDQEEQKQNKRMKTKSKTTDNDYSTTNSEVLQNIYKDLGLEEPEEEDSMPPVATLILEEPSRKTVHFKLERTEEEKEFALWCLLKEGQRVRKFLRSLWEEYMAGTITIQVAGEISDKASQIIRHTCEEFSEEFPELATFDQIADFLQMQITERHGCVEHFSYTSPAAGSQTDVDSDSAAVLCAHAFACLKLIRESFKAYGEKDDTRLDTLDTADVSHALSRD